MPALTGPLLSIDASGTIAKTITYSRWRGIKYARQRVIPANPNSTDQQAIRSVFSNLNRIWLYLGAYAVQSNFDAAKGRPLTDRNLFMKNNASPLYADSDYSSFVPYAAANGGPGGITVMVTPGVDQLTVDVTPPATPAGWTLTRVAGLVIRDSNPRTDDAYPTQEQSDATSTYQLVFTGLVTAMDYFGNIGILWEKPDGSLAWSASTTFTGVPT